MHFGLIWVLIEKLGASLLSVIVFFIYAKFLSTAEMGTAVMILSVTQFLAGLINTFFEDALVQKEKLHEGDIDTTFWAGIGLSLVTMAMTSLVFWAWLGDHPDSAHLLPLAIFATSEIILTSLMTTYVADLRRKGQFKLLAFRVLLGRIGGSFLGLLCIFGHFGAWGIIVQSVAGIALQYLILLATTRTCPGFNIHPAVLKQNFTFGSLIAMQRLLWDLLVRMTPLSAGIVGGASMAGIVGFAWRIVELPRNSISSGLYSYLLPFLSRFQNRIPELAIQYTHITALISFFLTPMFLGLYVIAPHMIDAIFGQKWIETVPVIQIFCIAALLNSYRIPANLCLNATGHPGKTLVLDTVTITLTIAMMFAFGAWGAWVAGLAHIFRFVVTLPKGLSLIDWKLGVSARSQIMTVIKYASPGLGMFAVLQGGTSALAPQGFENSAVIMICQMGMGVMIFAALAFGFFKTDIAQWRSGFSRHKNKEMEGAR